MDQTKIGKLIAKLRKEKGMTQRELGDKVGVGFKAVSKWERGITCPDISIINELSKILGITSDELLTGELSKEHQINNQNNQKSNRKLFLIITTIILIIGIIFIITKHSNNNAEVYKLASSSEEYYVEGKIAVDKTNIYLNINTLRFNDKKINKTMIKNYMYRIECNNQKLVAYGYLLEVSEIPNLFSVKEVMNTFNVNYEGNLNINKKELVSSDIELIITFIDENDNTIQKNIPLTID